MGDFIQKGSAQTPLPLLIPIPGCRQISLDGRVEQHQPVHGGG